MFNFENIHRNKKLAFLDGLLCGTMFASFAFWVHLQTVKDRHAEEKRMYQKHIANLEK